MKEHSLRRGQSLLDFCTCVFDAVSVAAAAVVVVVVAAEVVAVVGSIHR